jgi:hypothetical protein
MIKLTMLAPFDLAGFDQRRDDCPMFGSAVGACEQRILTSQPNRADGPFDNVIVEFDAAVVDEKREAFPARQGIANCLGQFALLADQRELCPKPRLEHNDQRSAFCCRTRRRSSALRPRMSFSTAYTSAIS